MCTTIVTDYSYNNTMYIILAKAEPLAVRANFVYKAQSKVGMYIGFLSVHFVVEEVHFFG